MRIWILAMLSVFFLIPSVQAHPHVFITPKAVVVANNHLVSQINVEWDFDDMSSSLFLESCGSNMEEIWNLVFPETQLLQNGSYAARTNYYTSIDIDGMPIDNLTPADFKADFVNGKLRCQFVLYINQNVNSTMRIRFNDPTIYNDFNIEQENFHLLDQGNGIDRVLELQTQNYIDEIYVSF
jgi:ABC-type uncharacterized transport system substrate-binding protein